MSYPAHSADKRCRLQLCHLS